MNDNNFAGEWLEIAHENYDAADFLYKTMRPKPLGIVLGHCQDAVAAALKGYLSAAGLETPNSGDAAKLCRHCAGSDHAFDYLMDDCKKLDRRANGTRYPPCMRVTGAQAERALSQTFALYGYVSERVNEILTAERQSGPLGHDGPGM